MKVVVVGCGRVGADLAYRLFQMGVQVSVVDSDPVTLHALPADFRGRTTHGDILNQEVLRRAGIEHADALAAVTPSDATNAVIAHIARVLYKVPNIVVRNYLPQQRSMLDAFDLQVVSPSSWGAQRIEELLTAGMPRAVLSAGNGEVEVYECHIPTEWVGRSIGELIEDLQCRAVAVTRAGKGILPQPDTTLLAGDIVHVSATQDGISRLRERFQANQGA